MIENAVILAGGRGTRMEALLGDLPKPMAELNGKPLLLHQIELCKKYGITKFLFLTHYRSEVIEEYFGDGSSFGVQIQYHRELSPLGTAGAVLDAWAKLPSRFFLLYGDTYLTVDLGKFHDFHLRENAEMSLLLHPNDHPYDSDILEIDDSKRVVAVHPYPHSPDRDLPNLVNAALYLFEKEALSPWRGTEATPFDFGKHLFPSAVKRRSRISGYQSADFIKDIGTPQRLEKVSQLISSRKIGPDIGNCACPAVFIDRDGTLTNQTGYVTSPDQIELVPFAAQAIRRLNESRILSILVTNQPVIARGDCSFEDLQKIHNRLECLLGKSHAYLDRIYFCPHHTDRGFPGERKELKVECSCRKPQPGMLFRAEAEMGVDLKKSWFIGDTTVDMEAARRAGVKSCLVKQGLAGMDGKYAGKPDFEFPNFAAAVDFILSHRGNENDH